MWREGFLTDMDNVYLYVMDVGLRIVDEQLRGYRQTPWEEDSPVGSRSQVRFL